MARLVNFGADPIAGTKVDVAFDGYLGATTMVYAGSSFPGSANEFGMAYDSATGKLFVQPIGADFMSACRNVRLRG